MTLETPLWLQALGGDAAIPFSAQAFRTLMDVLVTTAGVASSTDLAVTQRAAGANFSVDVAAGGCAIRGVDVANQGIYVCRNTATVNVAIAAAPVSGTRTDVVYAQVRDKQASGGSNYDWQITRVTGTDPAGAAPAIPNNAIELARITPIVPATGSITTSLIQDFRPRIRMADRPSFLLAVDQVGTATNTSTTVRVNVIPQQTFRLTATQRIEFIVHAGNIEGTSGGEVASLRLNVDAAEPEACKATTTAAGGQGATSSDIYYTASLGQGDHTVRVDVIRYAGGTQVSVNGTSLTVKNLRT